MKKNKLEVSAPGRICLFGEHQDYLELPVIASAVNMRMMIKGERRKDNLFNLEMPDVGERRVIDPDNLKYESDRDYLASAVDIVKKLGMNFRYGYNVGINSDIPINSGVSSSSALVIGWLRFLFESQIPDSDEDFLGYTLEQIAEYGYETEVANFGEAGGKMDHYTIALGGVVYIDTKNPVKISRLNGLRDEEFVLGDTLENKKTVDILRNTRKIVTNGFEVLKKTGFDKYKTGIGDVDFSLLDNCAGNKVRAALVNRDITQKAREVLGKDSLNESDKKYIGRLITKHQQQLRILGLSTVKLDYLVEASLKAGAYGAKLTGSGGGGCMFAYCDGERTSGVMEAIERAGGKAYCVKPDFGAWIHTGENYGR